MATMSILLIQPEPDRGGILHEGPIGLIDEGGCSCPGGSLITNGPPEEACPCHHDYTPPDNGQFGVDDSLLGR